MSETKIPTGPPPPYMNNWSYLERLERAKSILMKKKLEFFTNINNINNFLNSFKLILPEKTSPQYNNKLIKKYNEIIDLLHNKIIEANQDEDEGAEEELTDLGGSKLPLLANKGGKKRRRRKTKRKRKKSKRKSRKKRKTRRRKK
jgi:spore coat polysaccharide biosynthesis predicted glycosyltransferase SpsG